MKFTKFGKALLLSALSVAVVLSVTSCVQDYSVGFLYVTGTVTAQSSGNGIISGFKIDHNTGQLFNISGLPVASGGANPVRAVLLTGSRFLYVLNRGVTASGSANCTTADPCKDSNITLFAVGGNGILTAQETFFTQGINPFRIVADTSGNFLYVLDHDSPSNATCALALGASATTCGDITAFSVNQTTGRLQLIVNAQVTAANGSPLPYFPVPANPVDFAEAAGYFLTLSGPASTSYPYFGGTSVFPYSVNSGGNGQLTINQNSSQPLTDGSTAANTTTSGAGVPDGTALVYAGGVVYVLDNNAISVNFNGNVVTSPSQLLPYSLGSGGALSAENGGIIPDAASLSGPIYLIAESKGKFLYVANQAGNPINSTSPNGGLAGYVLTTSPAFQANFLAAQPFGTGADPQCLVEDPSDQYIYEANFADSTVTGRQLEPETGDLLNLRGTGTYSLQGQPTWCLVDGRTG
jgi:6-phosphogluconolactonase (cycloisomerase 2 family)